MGIKIHLGFISGFIKKNRLKLLFMSMVLYIMIAAGMIPMRESLTPQIIEMSGKLYSGEGITEPLNGIAFWGRNLNHVDTVYIDGRKNEDCRITYCTEERIIVQIPREVYEERNSFDIQVSKKLGGIYLFKGDKYEVEVWEAEEEAPQITQVSQACIYREGRRQRIYLNVDHLTENARLYLEETEVGADLYLESGIVGVEIDPDRYADRDRIELKMAARLSDGQLQYGNSAEIMIEDSDYKQWAHAYAFSGENMLILHGEGIGQGDAGPSCREAFLAGYENGYKVFGMEWTVTSDDVLVACDNRINRMDSDSRETEEDVPGDLYKRNNLPKTYKELCGMDEDSDPLTWTEMLEYLWADDELYIIVDTRHGSKEAAVHIYGKMAEAAKRQKKEEVLDRVAVQVSDQDVYRSVMETYPFKSVIYSLEYASGGNGDVLDFIDHSNVRAIALEQGSDRDVDDFFQELAGRDCLIYVHTVNDIAVAAQYLARGCSGVYTDSLMPGQVPEIQKEAETVRAELSGSQEEETYTADAVVTAQEMELNREYLLNYLREIKSGEYLVLMSVQDEATWSVDDDIAEALEALGVSSDYRNAYRQSYVGIMSGGDAVYQEFSDGPLEYAYVEGGNLFELRSCGHDGDGEAAISVNGTEDGIYARGLHIAVFNKKLGILQDRIVFDLYDEGLGHIDYFMPEG